MNEFDDQEIQRWAEKGMPPGTKLSSKEQEDLLIYEFLFKELAKEPTIELSDKFSAKVISRISKKKYRTPELTDFLLIMFFAIVGALGALTIIMVLNNDTISSLAVALARNKWALLFGFVCFMTIQYLDKKHLNKMRMKF